MTALRGIGWEHPRCIAPLEAAAAAWSGTPVSWTFRSLHEFNDRPLGELAADYDLLVVDHPHVPAAVVEGVLLPLDEAIDASELDRIRADSLGPNNDAYVVDGRPWALPIDAACHVSARRADLLDAPPATWDEVFVLAAAEPGAVALSLLPADALCSLLTLCAQHGDPVTAERLRFDPRAVELLVRLGGVVRPSSFTSSPPELLELMVDSDDLCYVPLGFGYRSYAVASPPVTFAPPPRPTAGGSGGAILGGAGIAVSAHSPLADEAARFAAWLSSPEVQRRVVAAAGGQAAAASVWSDAAADRLAGGFFAATAAAVRDAYVRPKLPAWPRLQLTLGRELADALRRGEPADRVVERLDAALEQELETATKGVTLRG